jgi:hypothetical protein
LSSIGTLEENAIEFLKEKGGCATAQEFADFWGMAYLRGAWRNLKKLQKAGIIEKRGRARHTKYCLTKMHED